MEAYSTESQSRRQQLRATGRRAMHPKTTRKQGVNPPAASMRSGKHPSSQGGQTWDTTEYRERFFSPHCPQREMSVDMHTSRSLCVSHTWIKHPPEAPQPPLPPKGHRRCNSAPCNPLLSAANPMDLKVDYTSVYKNDFPAWKGSKRQPFKLSDSLKVSQGLVFPKSLSKDGRSQNNPIQSPASQVQPVPIESITSYRSDYVPHPVQPRPCRKKVVYPSKGLLPHPPASLEPKVGHWHINQQLFDGNSEFLQQFKTWSLKTKFHGQSKESDNDDFPSTTHVDYMAHKCQCSKPVLPSVQTREKSKKPSQATTIKEDYQAWDTKQRFPSSPEEKDRPKKTTSSLCTPETVESSKTIPEPCGHHPEQNESAFCNASKKPQHPAENGASSNQERTPPRD